MNEKKKIDGFTFASVRMFLPHQNIYFHKCHYSKTHKLAFSENPPNKGGNGKYGDECIDTSQSKVLRDANIFKNLVPNKVRTLI